MYIALWLQQPPVTMAKLLFNSRTYVYMHMRFETILMQHCAHGQSDMTVVIGAKVSVE